MFSLFSMTEKRPVRLAAAFVATIVLAAVLTSMLWPGNVWTRIPLKDLPPSREAAQRMCSGDGFTASEYDPDKARRLMAGQLAFGQHPEFRLPRDPTWAEDPYGDQNWRSQYQKLAWVDVLRREGLRTSDQAMLDRYIFLLRDWIKDNPVGAAPSALAWREVPTALRATSLACAVGVVGMRDWVREALRTHGELLADPAKQVVLGNHGLFQNGGLIVAGCVLAEPDWLRLAHRRSDALLTASVDEQGVSNESISYQGITHRPWSELLDRERACGLPPWKHSDRLGRMGDILTHAAAPDGRPAMIGDTFPYLPPSRIERTTSEFAATRGKTGSMPNETSRIFDRGYAFGRSGWGTERPFEKESFWSLRFGQPLSEQVHGHQDHGSIEFVSHGRRLLWDQGTFRHDGGEMREYVQSYRAHNVVSVAGATYDPDARSDVIAHQNTDTHELITVEVRALRGVRWTRTLFYSKAGRYLLLDDRVRQTGWARSERTAVQRFHLGGNRETRIDGSVVRTTGRGADLGLFWIGEAPDLSVVRGQVEPMMGWRAMTYGKPEPVPVVEARTRARQPRFTTVAIPDPGPSGRSEIAVTDVRRTEDAVTATVASADAVERITVTPTEATVHPNRPPNRSPVDSRPGD